MSTVKRSERRIIQTKGNKDGNLEKNSSHSVIFQKYFENSNKDEVLEIFLKHLVEEHYFTEDEVHELVKKSKAESESMIPISIFDNTKLSALEAITKYLKEGKSFKYNKIATLLNRNDRTIWTTYNNAKKKMPAEFSQKPSDIFIPTIIFTNRNLSVLENITVHLKEERGLRYSQIAQLLKRNDRTIWTVYNRACKKRGEWQVKTKRGL